MAQHFSRVITPLTHTFTENTDISLDSNRHMMLHELQIITQEMRSMKLDLYRNEEKSKRLKIENDVYLQKLLDEMKEMKSYINELEMEKQRTSTENNELRTQVTALREKQEKEINESRSITDSNLRMIDEKYETFKLENDTHMQKLLEEMKEMKLYISELEMEKQRTSTENNELRTQVTALREKQEKEINELRSKTDSNLRMIDEKYKTFKLENDTHMQKLLEEMKEMKLYISELETEKQRTSTENNELRTQVTALREKQEKEINELRSITDSNLRMIEEKYKTLKVKNDTPPQNELVEMNEIKLFMNERTNAGQTEMRTQVSNHCDKQDKEINESRTIVIGQDTKINELETISCELNTENTIVKENVPTPIIINGLYEQMMEDAKSIDWSRSVELMKRHLDNTTPAYEQLNNITNYNRYPLEAAKRGYVELIQVMLDNGLPINKGYECNLTMLHYYAAYYGHNKLVKFLIERGADVNVRDILGNTSLHWAARNGYELVVQYLVDIGCNTTITNRDGKTAADVAKTPEIREIIRKKK